ncbi:MAG: hypothetical protein K0R38_6181 [Polyangiaceae bacterium]|nr:hypothetical protein [Polyangiaceae bacterium]
MGSSAGGMPGSAGSMAGGGAGPSSGAAGGSAGSQVDDGRPGRSLIRRLSNLEYDATIRTLFGDSSGYAAAFPTDSVVNGFTNNTDVQDVGPALAEQFLVVAEQVAAKATQNPDTLLGCKLADGETCIQSFIERFGQRAWRRPLEAVEREDLLGVFRAGSAAHGPTQGLKLLLETFLVSPSFLYRVEVGTPIADQPYLALTSWEVASRLSYFLTGAMPDDALFSAAAAGGLLTPESIATEAKRLLATPAARQQVADFFSGWLNLRAVERLERDPAAFPGWSSTLPPLLAEETRAFATQVIFSGPGDLKTLLTAPYTYGNPALAGLYGGTAGPVQDGVARIELPTSQRAGLLTQISFLASHAKEIQANPVCATCHRLIDPVGLAFENYDAAGGWREQEQGQPIDSSGDLTNTDVSGPINGVVAMAGKLAQSEIATECFVRNWFRFTFGRGEGDEEATRMTTITADFRAADGKVLELLIALTKTPDFRYLAKQVP